MRGHTPPSLVTVAVVAAALVAWSGTPSASVRPPKLAYDISTLPNGLTVVLEEDHSTPIVHLQLWYHVGSKNEKPGRTGFAHLFEHLMFKGSKNVQAEEHTSLLSAIGGQSNAYTEEDATTFWETVPSQYLPLVLWLEADRMATLRIDKDTFVSEREVVKEERRMRIENQPYGQLNEILYDQAFTSHPYKHPIIGSMADLEAASVEDVREFLSDVLRARERHDRARRRFRCGAGQASSSRSIWDACRRPRIRCRAISRRNRRKPGSVVSRCRSRGRCPPSSWPIT